MLYEVKFIKIRGIPLKKKKHIESQKLLYNLILQLYPQIYFRSIPSILPAAYITTKDNNKINTYWRSNTSDSSPCDMSQDTGASRSSVSYCTPVHTCARCECNNCWGTCAFRSPYVGYTASRTGTQRRGWCQCSWIPWWTPRNDTSSGLQGGIWGSPLRDIAIDMCGGGLKIKIDF